MPPSSHLSPSVATVSYLPRRLTKLYSDTKHHFVAQQAELEDLPELNELHRKLRVQKDRLIAWGLDWSDNSNDATQGSIDESVAQAGLTETVASVMGAIKDVLEQAEQIQQREALTGASPKAEEAWGKPASSRRLTPDKVRYDELLKDLTNSIDILYELSSSKRAINQGTYPNYSADHPTKPSSDPVLGSRSLYSLQDHSTTETTLVNLRPLSTSSNPSRLPPKLDQSDVILPDEEPPPYESISVPSYTRLIGHLRQSDTTSGPSKLGHTAIATIPVLVEYARFDPAYRTDGLLPPLDRLEALLNILALGVGRFGHEGGREAPAFGTLSCLGYFEDSKQPRFGLVFELPKSVYGGPPYGLKPAEIDSLRPATLLSLLQLGSKSLNPHHGSLPPVPPLEQRFRIASNLVSSFSKFYGSGFTHENVNSSNILLFRKPRAPHHRSRSRIPGYDLRSPYLCSFDCFSQYSVEAPVSESRSLDIYRHPLDPRGGHTSTEYYSPAFDLYGLGLILLEIGLWLPIADIFKAKYTLSDFKIRIEDIWIRKLAGKCGTAYMQAVRECVTAADQKHSDEQIKSMYRRILGRLHRCCLLDEEETLDYGIHDTSETSLSKLAGKYGAGASVEEGASLVKAQHLVGPDSHPTSLPTMHIQGKYTSQRSSTTKQPLLHEPIIATSNDDLDLHEVRDDDNDGYPRHAMKVINSPPTTLKEMKVTTVRAANAASTIQRAWRKYKASEKVGFQDYKQKVLVLQRHWQRRMLQRSSHTPESRNDPHAVASYPTSQSDVVAKEIHIQSAEKTKRACPFPRRKLTVQPLWKPWPELLEEWENRLLPRLMRICERALRDSTESSSIDLYGIGETPSHAIPTIIVTCTSTARVRAALVRRFTYDHDTFDLKVHKGKVRRSKLANPSRKRRPPHRSMMSGGTMDEVPALNPFHQIRPLCGASIGAYNGEHLPPVSFGGVVLVDKEPFGMSVHHMLDAPSEDDDDSDFGGEDFEAGPDEAIRSSAQPNPYLIGTGLEFDLLDSAHSFEISEDEDMGDDDAGSSNFAWDSTDEVMSDTHSEIGASECGDVAGVEVGDGEHLAITQPAIDDVDDDFFPCPEDREEDHLDSHQLGYVHASSGIRRWNRNGIVHEVDWSLLKLKDERLQPFNLIQGGKLFYSKGTRCPKLVDPVCRGSYTADQDEYPEKVAKADDLGGLRVHCFGRTTGLRGGMIGHAMTAVRIFGRKSYARSWRVSGGLGVGGDSGAWIIDNEQGRVCGHVLAWCNKNRVAYICPMEVLLEDIKRTLGASTVALPGNGEVPVGKQKTDDDKGFEMPDITGLSIEDVGGKAKKKFIGVPPCLDAVGARAGQMAS